MKLLSLLSIFLLLFFTPFSVIFLTSQNINRVMLMNTDLQTDIFCPESLYSKTHPAGQNDHWNRAYFSAIIGMTEEYRLQQQ